MGLGDERLNERVVVRLCVRPPYSIRLGMRRAEEVLTGEARRACAVSGKRYESRLESESGSGTR